MDEQHLGHDQFFEKLNELFGRRKGSDHGAVYLTQKRLTYGNESSPVADVAAAADFADRHLAKPMPLVVRVTNGKSKRSTSAKIKLSTIVQPHELDAFYTRYAEVCKAGMLAMKPRDRSKKKAKAKKKKTTAQ